MKSFLREFPRRHWLLFSFLVITVIASIAYGVTLAIAKAEHAREIVALDRLSHYGKVDTACAEVYDMFLSAVIGVDSIRVFKLYFSNGTLPDEFPQLISAFHRLDYVEFSSVQIDEGRLSKLQKQFPRIHFVIAK